MKKGEKKRKGGGGGGPPPELRKLTCIICDLVLQRPKERQARYAPAYSSDIPFLGRRERERRGEGLPFDGSFTNRPCFFFSLAGSARPSRMAGRKKKKKERLRSATARRHLWSGSGGAASRWESCCPAYARVLAWSDQGEKEKERGGKETKLRRLERSFLVAIRTCPLIR